MPSLSYCTANLRKNDPMNDPLIDIYPWTSPLNETCEVQWAVGFALLLWPSGRHTLEMYKGVVTISRVYGDVSVEIRQMNTQNLKRTMWAFCDTTVGMSRWVRVRKGRRKARLFTSLEWVTPSTYRGPKPGRGGLLEP